MLPVVLVLLLFGRAFSAEVKTHFFPYSYEKVALKNGFWAYLIPVKGSGLVAYSSVVRTGGRDEWEPGTSGFSHFFEHMMFRGSENYPGPLYEQTVTYTGASVTAYTRDDFTCYSLVFPSRYLETIMTLESDRFRNLSYDEAAFKTEAAAVHGEYLKGRVNPYTIVLEEVLNLAFDVHPYKYAAIGFEEDIKAMPDAYEVSLSFFSRYYRPENVVLVMAGELDPGVARHL
ncbi:MAG TPA: pitrilysin family protein, partial [Candidatus Methylomirabilis sp.]|nr:pitrilysin family protein [Candidatus Methylomirabilis sp.]